MRVKIHVESTKPRDPKLHDASHRAEVYPADDPGAQALMRTGWNYSENAARQHARNWARMNDHEVIETSGR